MTFWIPAGIPQKMIHYGALSCGFLTQWDACDCHSHLARQPEKPEMFSSLSTSVLIGFDAAVVDHFDIVGQRGVLQETESCMGGQLLGVIGSSTTGENDCVVENLNLQLADHSTGS